MKRWSAAASLVSRRNDQAIAAGSVAGGAAGGGATLAGLVSVTATAEFLAATAADGGALGAGAIAGAGGGLTGGVASATTGGLVATGRVANQITTTPIRIAAAAPAPIMASFDG